MTKIGPLLLVTLFVLAPVRAQGQPGADQGQMSAPQALDVQTCTRLIEGFKPRMEEYTLLKFRRPVPVKIEPKIVWEQMKKSSGFGGFIAAHGLAFYAPGRNDVTVVPWVIGRKDEVHTRQGWEAIVEPILIHEMMHALHHQNFFTEGRFYGPSLQSSGLTEEQIDRATVDFLLDEGSAELVALRTTLHPGNMLRSPDRELAPVREYMRKYRPDGRESYRTLLSKLGYQDGLSLCHHITLLGGARALRAVLYRQPHRALLFDPKRLCALHLDAPPEPGSIFALIHPGPLSAEGILLACDPGRNSFFQSAADGQRAEGCLLGYTAKAGSDSGDEGHYSLFVSDPDHPGTWSKEQAASLKALNPKGATEKEVDLPRAQGVKADLIVVNMDDGSKYVRAETSGLVVMAHEQHPSDKLEELCLLALRVLYIKKPTPHLYDKAVAELKQELGSDFTAADKPGNKTS